MTTIWIDGKYYKKEEAVISVYDHGLLYGDGLFEGIRIYSSQIFRLQDHLDRLYDGAKALMIEIPYSQKEMADILQAGLKKSEKKEGYIRLVVTRGVGDLGINPKLCKRPSVIMIIDDIQLYPTENYENGVSLVTASVRRVSRDSLDPRIKTLNYMNNILAKIEAQRSGCMEALFLNTDGYVVECTADNFFFVKNGTLHTPLVVLGALGGITRKVVLELASKIKQPWAEGTYSLFDVYTADECFMTGSGAELVPVTVVDGRSIGNGKPGPVTGSLRKAFREYVNNL